jgi:hypothetical protein
MPLPGPREIPSQEKILAVSELDVLNENGRAVTFGSLFTKEKTVAVFIRTYRHLMDTFPPLHVFFVGHFWCAVRNFPVHSVFFDRSHRHLTDMPGEFAPDRGFRFPSHAEGRSPT